MFRPITEAKKLLNAYLPLVVLIGLLQFNMQTGIATAIITSIGLMAALCLEIVLFARIVTSVQREHPPTVAETLKQNAFNYLVVLVVLFAPVIGLHVLLRSIGASSIDVIIARNMLAAFVSCLSIYVIPMVFLRGTHLSAIPAGLAYLLKNLSESLKLMGLVILRYACVVLGILASIKLGGSGTFVGIINVAANVAATALMVLVFAAATYVICGNTKRVVADET